MMELLQYQGQTAPPRGASGEGDVLSPHGILCACAVPEWYNHQAIFAGFETIFYKNFGNSKILFTFAVSFCACGVMVAALDLGSNVSGRGGSSPFMRTRIKEKFPVGFFSFFCLYIKSTSQTRLIIFYRVSRNLMGKSINISNTK